MNGRGNRQLMMAVILATVITVLSGTVSGQAKKPPAKPPIGPPPAGDLDFDKRAEWLISLFPKQSIRGHQKTGLPDAVGRLAATNGADEQAKAYIIRYPC